MFLANGNSTFISELTGRRLLEKNEDLTKVIVYILNRNNFPSGMGVHVTNNKIIVFERVVSNLPTKRVLFYMQRICGQGTDDMNSIINVRVLDVSSFIYYQ